MRREWEPEELLACWTLVGPDWGLIANKSGPTRLGFALLLKFFDLDGRFPRSAGDVPPVAVDYVAHQLHLDPSEFAAYSFSGRTIEYHRAQIRSAMGFRACSVADEDKLASWLAVEVCPVELREDHVRGALLTRCRAERIEPPGPSRLDRVVGTARAAAERAFCDRTVARLFEATIAGLEALLAPEVADGAERVGLAEVKADPGKLSLETLLREVARLGRVRSIGLPSDLFSDCSEKLVEAWRARAARAYPSDLLDAPRPVRLTLLAALCWTRQTEITDALVDLLIGLIHIVNARAERRVERELLDDLRRVRNKEGVLFALAEAALARPDETVRAVVFPVVGEATLRDLVREAQGEHAGVPDAGTDGAEQFLHRPLPADVAAVAGGAGFSVQQHGLPAGGRRARVAAPVCRSGRSGQVLRRRRTDPDRGGGAAAVA